MTVLRPAPAVARHVADLIRTVGDHNDLDGVRIECVFRDKPAKSKGQVTWASARKIGGLNAYLASTPGESGIEAGEADFFVLEVWEGIWQQLDDAKRRALVDHELMHCAVEFDEDNGERTLKMRGHDHEEFLAVLERNGFWNERSIAVANAVSAIVGAPDYNDSVLTSDLPDGVEITVDYAPDPLHTEDHYNGDDCTCTYSADEDRVTDPACPWHKATA